MFMLQEFNMSNLVKTEQCIQIQTYTFYIFFLLQTDKKYIILN